LTSKGSYISRYKTKRCLPFCFALAIASLVFSRTRDILLINMGMRHSVVRSFKYALEGMMVAIKNEPNLRIHIFFAVLALTLGTFLKLNTLEWLILAFTIFWVISLELLNTVLESIVDLVSPEVKGAAKVAKDVSAACVLLSAILSIVVGALLFLPKIILL